MDWQTTISPNSSNMTSIDPPLDHVKSYPVPVIMTSAISCVMSIIGSFVIFGTYIAMPDIRNLTRRLVLCLTVADFLTCTGYLVSVIRYCVSEKDVDVTTCRVQSAITTYSSLVSFFLTVIIAFHLFVLVVCNFERASSWVTLFLYNAVCWGFPAIIIAIALSQEALGPDTTLRAGTGPWCWVDTNHPHSTFWMVLTGKGWEIACYLLTMTLYVLLKLHTLLQMRGGFSQIHHTLRDEDRNFMYVWFFLYAVRVWGTVRFFLYTEGVNPRSVHAKIVMEALLYLQAAGDPSQAFFNSILFCLLDKTVRSKMCNKRRGKDDHINEGVNDTERKALLQNEATSSDGSLNSDYGTGHNPMTSWSQSSELTPIAEKR